MITALHVPTAPFPHLVSHSPKAMKGRDRGLGLGQWVPWAAEALPFISCPFICPRGPDILFFNPIPHQCAFRLFFFNFFLSKFIFKCTFCYIYTPSHVSLFPEDKLPEDKLMGLNCIFCSDYHVNLYFVFS